MNNVESTIFKVFMWVMGGMATAILMLVSMTYQSQKNVESGFNDFRVTQTKHNDYTIRRLNSDSVELNRLRTDVLEIKVWIKEFKESPAKCKKLEAILPKEQETTHTEPNLDR